MSEFSNQSWQVEVACPQCGAPVILEEADRILPCGYCRTRLYISCRDYFRYYLPPTVPSVKEILFIPYWRIKGIVFSCRDSEIKQRILDSNYLALKDRSFSPTLGLRPQVLKLRFFGPQTEGSLIKPHFSLRAPNADSTDFSPFELHLFRKLPGYYETFIGETRSLIHSPVFIRGNIYYDAILDRPLSRVSEAGETHEVSDERQIRPIEFLSTLCPRCGWDLQGEKETLVLSCKNCDSAWESRGSGFGEVEFAVMPGSTDESTVYLPFWRINARIQGVSLQNYADLVRFANLPRKVQEADENRSLHFWIPAFKVNPTLFLRLAKLVTIFQPPEEFDGTLPKAPLYPVTLPIGEGNESVKITTAFLAVPRSQTLSRLSEIQVSIDRHLLTYIPFSARGSEMLQTDMGISIQKNALNLGRLI